MNAAKSSNCLKSYKLAVW